MTNLSLFFIELGTTCIVVSYSKDKILLKKIALRVKALRASHVLTQKAVYEDTGIHIGRLETGKVDLSVSNLKKICDYFEITLEEFFHGF